MKIDKKNIWIFYISENGFHWLWKKKKKQKNINLNFIHFINLNKIQYNLVIWKKNTPFSKKIKINYYYYYLKFKHLKKYIYLKLCIKK